MAHPVMSHKKAHTLALVLFLFGMAILIYVQKWWPGIMLVIGLPIALRQYLLGRRYDMAISLFVFVGVFITVQFNIAWQIILPVLFSIGGFYIFFREFFGGTSTPEDEEEEDLNLQIEEEQRKKHKKEK
jgi:predicted membrane protein